MLRPNNQLMQRVQFIERTVGIRLVDRHVKERLDRLTDEQIALPETVKSIWLTYMTGATKTTGTLENGEGEQCCLGNLCRAYMRYSGSTLQVEESETFHTRFGEQQTSSYLPYEVEVWAHISGDLQHVLAGFNDQVYGNDKDFRNMRLLVAEYL